MEPTLDPYRLAYLASVKDDVSTELSNITFEVTKLRQRAHALHITLEERINAVGSITDTDDPVIAEIKQYDLAAGRVRGTLANAEGVMDQAVMDAGV